MKEIYFYIREEEYGWMSNFERSEQVVDSLRYETNEHYYQSQKPYIYSMREWIRNAPSAYAAMCAGRSLRQHEIRENWDIYYKFEIMQRGLFAKFIQNKELGKKLLETGDAIIHEANPKDMTWGMNGKDMLGKMLMNTRDMLEENKRGIDIDNYDEFMKYYKRLKVD